MRKTSNNTGSGPYSPTRLNQNRQNNNQSNQIHNDQSENNNISSIFNEELMPFECEIERQTTTNSRELRILEFATNSLKKEIDELLASALNDDDGENENDNLNKKENKNKESDKENEDFNKNDNDNFGSNDYENGSSSDENSDIGDESIKISDDDDDFEKSKENIDISDIDSSDESTDISDDEDNNGDENTDISDIDYSSDESADIGDDDGRNSDKRIDIGDDDENIGEIIDISDMEDSSSDEFDDKSEENGIINDDQNKGENGENMMNNENNDNDDQNEDENDKNYDDDIDNSKNTNYVNLQIFQKEFKKYFNAKFLTSKAKFQIFNFINQDKYSRLPLKQKCDIINISRKTIYNYQKGKMNVDSQIKRSQKKGRKQTLTEQEKTLFIEKCREKREAHLAVTTKYAQKLIEKITTKFGHKWKPCETTVGNIFKECNWSNRKSQKRHPQSDPIDKPNKIKKFYHVLKKIIKRKKLKKNRVHIMDETGLYSDSIPPNTWTFKEDKEAYVKSTGQQRRDTLVGTLRADGKGFATFIEHRNMKTRKEKKTGKKIIIDQGVKGMNIEEMKKWNKIFFEHSQRGDVLIMDNLGSHHNKEILQELKDQGITVLFIPVRCADVLSVLDNCFFAIYKQYWYRKVIKIKTVDQKKSKAIKLFNKLIKEGFWKKMFEHCKYDKIFKDKTKLIQNETSNTPNK